VKPVETIRAEEIEDWNRNADFYRHDESSPLMRRLADLRAEFYDLKPGQRVLDLGCGTGGATIALRNRGLIAFGLDYAPRMVQQARSRVTHSWFVRGNGDALPFADAAFDTVIADGVLHHLAVQRRLEPALAEIRRVLKPGGTLACFDRNGSFVSSALLRLCIAGKECLRFLTRRPLFASSATRNEIPFGGPRDLDRLRRAGFVVQRRRPVASAPFFVSVVAMNATCYFLSSRLRHRLEHRLTRFIEILDNSCSTDWLSVEQLLCCKVDAAEPA